MKSVLFTILFCGVFFGGYAGSFFPSAASFCITSLSSVNDGTEECSISSPLFDRESSGATLPRSSGFGHIPLNLLPACPSGSQADDYSCTVSPSSVRPLICSSLPYCISGGVRLSAHDCFSGDNNVVRAGPQIG